jgi:hypothetical protein
MGLKHKKRDRLVAGLFFCVGMKKGFKKAYSLINCLDSTP